MEENKTPPVEVEPAPVDITPGPTRPREISGVVYKGPDPDLKGKTALVKVYPDYVKAQFDDLSTGQGLGWHTFHLDDFEGIEGDDTAGESKGREVVVEGGVSAMSFDAKPYLADTPPVNIREEVLKAAAPAFKTMDTLWEQSRRRFDESRRRFDESMEGFGPDARPRPSDGLSTLNSMFRRPTVAPPLAPTVDEALFTLSRSAAAIARRLDQLAPVVIELRDASRMIGWGLVTVIGLGLLAVLYRMIFG